MTRLAALFARLGPDPRADGSLLNAFLSDRDEAAFAELVRRHGPTVWGVCRRALPEVADAEDAFQATFLVLLRRRPGGESLAAWLYRVAVLTSRGVRRKNARRRTLPLLDVPVHREPPAVDVDALLLRLPERERAAVVLCHLHGLTQREAATRLGVPEGTLSARLSRGLRRLRGAAPAAMLVPATVAEAAVTVAAAGRAAGPGVGSLVSEVLRMFWLKKLATAGLAIAGAMGFGVGLGVVARPVSVVAADPPPAANPPGADAVNAAKAALKAATAEWDQLSEEATQAAIKAEEAKIRVARLRRQLDLLKAKALPADDEWESLRKRFQAEVDDWAAKEKVARDKGDSSGAAEAHSRRGAAQRHAEDMPKVRAVAPGHKPQALTLTVSPDNGSEWFPQYAVKVRYPERTTTVVLASLDDVAGYLAPEAQSPDRPPLTLELRCETDALKEAVRAVCRQAGFAKFDEAAAKP